MVGLFYLIIIFLILYFSIVKKGINFSSTQNDLLNKVLTNQQFSNINTFYSSSTLHLLSADSHGENYVFATKNGNVPFSSTDLHTIYDLSKRSHIHNVVIVSSQIIPTNSELNRTIKDYNFEVWNNAKLFSLLTNNTSGTYTKSVLRTSDTSYDTCKIDNSTVDPVQYGKFKSHSLFGNIFNRPNRL